MFLGLLFFLNLAQAMTPEQVLKTAWNDKTYLVHDSIHDTDSKNPFRSVEGFYSNEQNGKVETEVGLKLNLKSFAEWKSGRLRTEQRQILKESSLSWALRDRYAVVLSYVLGEKKLEVISESIETAERHLKAQALSMRAIRTNSKNYLNAKEELMRLTRAKSLLLEEKEILKKRLQRWSPDEKNPTIDGADLVNADDIFTVLQDQAPPPQSLTAKLAKEEILQLNQELQILRGRENQWLKSLEIAQVNKKDDKYYEFGVTIQLPPLGSDDWARQRQNELLLKTALKRRDLENTSDHLQILRFKILNAVELYKHSKAGRFVVAKSRSLDPLVNIQTRLSGYKEQLDLLSQRQSILNLYLEYLVESETLSKESGVNHLSRAKKAIL